MQGVALYPAWHVRYVIGARPHVAAATWGTMGSRMRGAARLMKKFGVMGKMRMTVTGSGRVRWLEAAIRERVFGVGRQVLHEARQQMAVSGAGCSIGRPLLLYTKEVLARDGSMGENPSTVFGQRLAARLV